MIDWYPGAVHDPHDDVGPFVGGAPYRGVLHTTESAHFPTYKPGTHPHFTVWLDADSKPHVTQHVPISHASSALVHASGQIDTNREGAIQIEIAWFAEKITTAPQVLLLTTRNLMRWIESQTRITRTALPFKAYPASYGPNNGVRLTVDQWKTFTGWCGHEHVPENDHGDPGQIDLHYLLTDPTIRPKILYPRLKVGASGKWVVKLQTLLNAHGAQLHVDGSFGPATGKAVNQFKAKHGLPVNGVVGPGAWSALTR